MQTIKTTRLMLRPLTLDDADHLPELFSDPAVVPAGSTQEDRLAVEAWVRWNREHVVQHGFGLRAVVHRESGALIGYCGLCRQPDAAGRDEVEIGCAVLPAHRGRGYAAEAALACRDEGFHRLGLGRLVAFIHPADAAARRVAEKIGMHHPASQRPGRTHPGRGG